MSLEPAPARSLDAVFNGINRGDEAGFIAAFSPNLRYFGSLTGTVTHGLGPLRGVFRATRDVVGFERVEVLQTYGQRRECAVHCGLHLPGGTAPAARQVMVFQWDEQGLIDRFSILWDAAGFLARKAGHGAAPGQDLLRLGPSARRFLDAYVGTFSRDDLDAHVQLLAPEIEVFGSLMNAETYGLASAKGVFSSARANLGIRSLVPLEAYGDAPEFAVRMGLARSGSEPHQAEGIWVFCLKEDGRLTRLSILWNPLPYLKQGRP